MKLKKDLFVVALSGLAAALFLGVFLQTQPPSSAVGGAKQNQPGSTGVKVAGVDKQPSLKPSRLPSLEAPAVAAQKIQAKQPLGFQLSSARLAPKALPDRGSEDHQPKKLKVLSERHLLLTSLPDLKKYQKGSRIGIPLSNGSSYDGVVNLVKTGKDGTVRVGGSLDDNQGGFALSQGPQGFRGLVRLPELNRAFVIEPEAGLLVMKEHKLGDIECQGMPRKQGEAAALAAAAQAASYVKPVIPLFDTKPSETAVIYLDFDGEYVTDSIWNNGNDIDARPPIYFGRALSDGHIRGVVESVSQDFMAFNVSITTDESRYNNAPVGQRMRCIITITDPITLGAAAGVAYLNSWSRAGSTFDDDVPCWVYGMYDPVNMAQVVSHEVGHTLGLSHDGRNTSEYYAGHGTGASSWAPIMGASYDRRLTQWSIGDYNGATNTEDDIAIIASPLNKIGYIADDYPSPASAWSGLASSADGVKQAAVAADNRIYLSTDSGTTWTPAESIRKWRAIASSSDGTKLYAAETLGRIYKSTDSGATWSPVAFNANWRSIACSSDGTKLVAAVFGGKLHTSTDSGTTWTERENNRNWSSVDCSSDAAVMLAAASGGQLYVSSDTGVTWAARDSSRVWTSVAVSSDGTRMVAVTSTNATTGVVYTSSNSGNAWVAQGGAGSRPWTAVACSADGSRVYAAANGTNIYSSTDFGVNWTARDNPRAWSVLACSDDGTRVLAAETDGFIYRSANSGVAWAVRALDLANTTVGDTINGSFDTSGTIHSGSDQDWFRFESNVGAANQNGAFNFSVAPLGTETNLDLKLSIYDSAGQLVGSSEPVNSRNAGVFGNLGSGFYYLAVSAGAEPFTGNITSGFTKYGDQGSYRVTGFFTPRPAVPRIDAHPQSVAAVDGTTITLSVTASGSGGLTYQWLKNGALMSGERQRTLRLANMDSSKAGSYSVIVTNATDNTLFRESDPAVVTVNFRPKIASVSPTRPVKAEAGNAVNLAVNLTATGTPPFTYRWERIARPANVVVRTVTRPEASDTLAINPATFFDAGSYRVVVTNVTGTVVTSANMTLTVDSPPVILNPQPADLVIEQGRSGRLAVLAAGLPRLNYEWFKVDRTVDPNVETAVGTNSPTLTLPGQPLNAGTYFVRVANSLTPGAFAAGVKAQSRDVTVEVDARPVIVTQPVGGSLQAGDTGVTLSVVAGGTATGRTFKWFKDGKPYTGPGNNTDTLTFAPSLAWQDRGAYFVEVRNRVGMVKSAVATLRVSSKPIILTPPVSVVGATNGSVKFTLTAGGDSPLRYQWFKDGAPATAVTGIVASPTLTLSRLTSANAGSYFCRVSNGHRDGSTDTNPLVTLAVEDPPKVTAITSNFASNAHRCAIGADVTITPTATGTPPFTYQWLKAGRPFAGGTVNPATGALTLASVLTTDAGAYSVIVTNRTVDVNGRAISSKSASLNLSVLIPPAVVRPPRDQAVTEGQPVTMSIDATGSPTLLYKWFKVINVGGVDQLDEVRGQTRSALVLSRPTPDDSGRYRCEVRNAVGTVTSPIGSLTISPIPPPVITGFQPTKGMVNDLVMVNGSNLGFLASAKIGGKAASLTLLNNNQVYVKVPAGLTKDTQYFIEVTSQGQGGTASTTPARFTFVDKAANDAVIDATILTGTQFGFQGDTTGFTDSDADDIAGYVASAWHWWTVPLTGRYTLTTKQGFNIVLARFSGIPGGNIARIGNVVNNNVVGSETVTFTATPGQSMVFYVAGQPSGAIIPSQGKYALIMTSVLTGATRESIAREAELTAWVGQTGDETVPSPIASPEDAEGNIRLGGDGRELTLPMLVWNEQKTAPATARKTVAVVKMQLDLPEEGTDDRFGWTAVDAEKSPMAALWVDARDGGLRYTSASGATTELRQKMIAGSKYAIELVHDARENALHVLFDGVVLHTDTSLKASSSFSTISASYQPSSNGGAHGAMIFSDLDVRFE